MSAQSETNEVFKRLPSIPKKLHSEFKLCCVKKGISMQSASEVAIMDWIKRNNQEVTRESET